MHVLPRLKLFLHQICTIVFRGNNQRPMTLYREYTNVRRVITEILFTGERNDYATVFDSLQSTRHYEDLLPRRKREDCDLARYYRIGTPDK